MGTDFLFKIVGLTNYEIDDLSMIILKAVINSKILKKLINGIIIQLEELDTTMNKNSKYKTSEYKDRLAEHIGCTEYLTYLYYENTKSENILFDNGDTSYIINLSDYPPMTSLVEIPLNIVVAKPIMSSLLRLNINLYCKNGDVKNAGFSKQLLLKKRSSSVNDINNVNIERSIYELNLEDIL